MKTFQFSQNIQEYIDFIINERKLNVTIKPAEPPFIIVENGKHKNQQKLGRFFKSNSNLMDSSIKELVEDYKEINSDLSQYKVKYQTNYVEVYKTPLYAIGSITKSCMTYEDCVQVYGYDDRLSLLCVYKNSVLIARTLVRDDKGEYIRIYIDHNNIKEHIIKAIITNEGFTPGDLEGIKLDYILDNNNNIVCPYLDRYANHVTIIDEDHLIISSDGEYEANSTNGYIEIKGCECYRCGDFCTDNEITVIDGCDYCEDCVSNNFILINDEWEPSEDCVYCISDGEYYLESDCNIVNINGDYYLIDDENIIYIEGKDDYYLLDDCEKLEINDGNDYYALAFEVIENEKSFDHITQGYYLKEQLEVIIDTIEQELEHVQDDLFQDNKKLLNDELEHIKWLIG